MHGRQWPCFDASLPAQEDRDLGVEQKEQARGYPVTLILLCKLE